MLENEVMLVRGRGSSYHSEECEGGNRVGSFMLVFERAFPSVLACEKACFTCMFML